MHDDFPSYITTNDQNNINSEGSDHHSNLFAIGDMQLQFTVIFVLYIYTLHFIFL